MISMKHLLSTRFQFEPVSESIQLNKGQMCGKYPKCKTKNSINTAIVLPSVREFQNNNVKKLQKQCV